jgi:hypothetical protein
MQDSTAVARLLDQVAAEHPAIRKVWVDGGYRQHLVEHAAVLGIDMETTGEGDLLASAFHLRWRPDLDRKRERAS